MDYPRQKGKDMVGQAQTTPIAQSGLVPRGYLLFRLWTLFTQRAIPEGTRQNM